MWRTLRWILFGLAAAGCRRCSGTVSMRLVALSVSHGVFTDEGSVLTASIYVLATTPLAVVAALTQRWWRWLFPGRPGACSCCSRRSELPARILGHVGDMPSWRWVWLVAASIGVFATLVAAPVATVWAVDRQRSTRCGRA